MIDPVAEARAAAAAGVRRSRQARQGLRALVGLLLALAVPGIACLCWYASEAVPPAHAAWGPLVAAAWPVMLVSGAGLCVALLAQPRRAWAVRACAAAFAMSAVLLLAARAHWVVS